MSATDPRRDPEFEPAAGPSNIRAAVLILFCCLAFITYLDRICISQAAAKIRKDLGLSAVQMGQVFSAFTLAYMIFEIPGGRLGDRLGSRKTLARIVLWWSGFTALSGAATGRLGLILIRFGFGAGEAGAYPNLTRALVAWFSPAARGRVQGLVWTSSRLGGAVAPILTAAVMSALGWRATFLLFSLLGPVWTFWFWRIYRDDPRKHPTISKSELAEIAIWSKSRSEATDPATDPAGHSSAPWRAIATNRSVLALSSAMFWTSFSWYFYITWLPQYLSSKGWSESWTSILASLCLFLGVFGCAVGGRLNDALTVRWGSHKWSRRVIGVSGAGSAAVLFWLGVRMRDPSVAIALIAPASFCSDLALPGMWASIMDVGEDNTGAVAGWVNTAGGLGAFLLPILMGWMLDHGMGWGPGLELRAAGFLAAAVSWLFADPTRRVVA